MSERYTMKWEATTGGDQRAWYHDNGRWMEGDEVLARLNELQAIVDRLPKTADGANVAPGMTVWYPGKDGVEEHEVSQFWDWSSDQESWDYEEAGIAVTCWNVDRPGHGRDLRNCYSTRKAAEAARASDD